MLTPGGGTGQDREHSGVPARRAGGGAARQPRAARTDRAAAGPAAAVPGEE